MIFVCVHISIESTELSQLAILQIDVLLSPEAARTDMSMLNIGKLDFAAAFEKSDMALRVLDGVQRSRGEFSPLVVDKNLRPFAVSYWKQFTQLLLRCLRTTLRDPLASVVNLTTAVILAFIIGCALCGGGVVVIPHASRDTHTHANAVRFFTSWVTRSHPFRAALAPSSSS